MSPVPPQTPQLTAGTTLTSASGVTYAIRQLVGRESTGEIYLGHTADAAAVFVHHFDAQLLAGKRGVIIRRAIERGFELSSELRHPALLAVLDRIVWNGESLHGVVTEHSDGPHLSDYIEEYGALPVDVVIGLFAELVEALAVLHDSDRAHGALCPEVIRVELVAERMAPKLEGTYLAPLAAHVAELDAQIVPFRPPQHAPGLRGAMLDDIYAFGALLAFTLTGVRPDAPDFQASLDRAEGLPDSMRSMLVQCLQIDASRRFQSLVAVRNVLRVLIEELEERARRSPERPEPGDVVAGQYEIERLLGEGGMARVYLARDQALGTRVALKLLNGTCLEEPAVVERFLQEASIQARLVHPEPHPNIVAVHRVLRDTPVGYVMEFVEGDTLEDLIQERRLSERALIGIFMQIADGLHHAHENRIVHRDLKPSNILLVDDGQGGWLAKLMDFGISKQLDQPRTRTNLVLGTLGYISPELFISAKDASPASDLYALGCTMFEALTGDVPFSVNGGMRQLAFRVYNEAPPTPSSRGVEVSAELESIIMMMLAKKPDERPPSAAWVRDRLQTLVDGARDEALAAAVAAHRESLADTDAADSPFGATTMRTRLDGKTTRREVGPATAPATEGNRSRTVALIAAVLVAVVLGIVAAVLLTTGGEAESGAQAEAPDERQAPPPPRETVEAVAPVDAEPGRTTLPASRVVGAADLLAQARERAEAGDKRAALALYEQAVATYDTQDQAPDTREQADALVEMAQLYEAVAEEESAPVDGGEPSGEEGITVESASLLAAASSAYGRAGELTQDYTMFLQKAELDQQRGDASGALEALRAAAEMTDDEAIREETQKQAQRLEQAYAEGADDDERSGDDERAKRGVPVGPLPPNMIELWIETKPDRATVYLGKKRLGRTPLIKRLPKGPGTIEVVLKASGRYTERLQIDGTRGGRFEVPMAFKPQKIK